MVWVEWSGGAMPRYCFTIVNGTCLYLRSLRAVYFIRILLLLTKIFPMKFALLLLCLAAFCSPVKHMNTTDAAVIAGAIKTGAEQTELYVPYLKGKRVAIMANQTTIIGKSHLVDSLQKIGVKIVKVFGPKHGFRGNKSAGESLDDEIDSATGIPLISLYGKKNKPTKEDLADVDVLVYDLQDVGVRFYTNINALSRLMEACAESNKELLILAR